MTKTKTNQIVGVIGAGSFGTAIADLISDNAEVIMYARRPEVVQRINETHQHLGINLSKKIKATNDAKEVAQKCTLIFLVVPSVNFRDMMQMIGAYIRPYHILIHGTKGLDLSDVNIKDLAKDKKLSRANVHTMSEVILQESSAVRVGCLSGPNLSVEILEGQPTATVIASHFKEVIQLGEKVLNSRRFHVFGTYDLLGAELAGVLKNGIALGSGILAGKGMGKNIQAILITRGLTEMIHFGKAMGAKSSAFLGTAGIGDLIATATSEKSRNYSLGMRLAKGEKLAVVTNSMPELAEGIRTLKITKHLADYYKIRVPITQMLYSIVFEDFDIDRALTYLMKFPYGVDVDFL